MTRTATAHTPLAGLRVLDLTRNLPGPFATRLLADLGAEVVKIEPPEGDPARHLGSLFDDLNHGKDCRRIDFRKPEGLASLREWIAGADVLIEGFRPGVMQAMGLGFDAVRALQPRIVMCSITGYGQQGPWAARAGHDMNYLAVSGVLDQVRSLAGDPAQSNVQWGDMAGGSSMACVAILAALYEVSRHGQARFVDISMTHGLHRQLLVPKATNPLISPLLGRAPQGGEDLLGGGLPCYRLYRTADGRWLAVAALELKFWQLACQVFGKPEWSTQHWQLGLFPNTPASNALRDEVAALVATQTLAHWVGRFDTVDACVTPVLTLAEAQQHPLFAQPRHPWVLAGPASAGRAPGPDDRADGSGDNPQP